MEYNGISNKRLGLPLVLTIFVDITTPHWMGRHSRMSTFRKPMAVPNLGDYSLVHVEEARRFIRDCLKRIGVPELKLRCVSEFLVAADYRGIYGSGLSQLDIYLNDLLHRRANMDAEPEIIRETVATAHVNGNDALGVIVGNFCMSLALEKAKNVGVGFVVANRSNNLGIASWYALQALDQDYAGLVMSNGAPIMVPPRSSVASIGANCLAFGVKGRNSYFMLDMVSSMKDIGSIEWALTKHEYIPHLWAADERGYSTCFPMLALRNPRLTCAGANKGYCLAAMIDLLCGVLSGANFSTQIPPWRSNVKRLCPNLGQIFIVIDPDFFLPDFMDRLDDFTECIKNSTPASLAKPIQMPGDREMRHMLLVEKLGALPYHNALLKKYNAIADLFCIKPIQLFNNDD
ncbi:uncharacterized protein LOC6599685 [Drosophila persimilis]|uniref:uncharacterized protein LOC6599685 n=1 Tax=Drosophila persimilis TaxID=7234 RepID=UPI000F09350D|nr:uncharacterized protein LOC6599685 [Drosophila persimilis]